MKPIGKPLASTQLIFASHRVPAKLMLQLGWKAGTEQYSPDELLEYAVLAEQAGFDPGCERHENPIRTMPVL